MAPIRTSGAKRPRAHTNDEAGRKARNKRLRASTPTTDLSDVDTSSEAESRNPDNDSGSEQSGDDADEEAALDEQATQSVARHLRATKNKQNTAADQGIIEEVRCTNFMCHEQLTVTLGPLINFICGHNGSGKSAVLTALTLCLGGKATATNRGQNLKSFIKEGRDYCSLSVKIKNQGSSAYKPDMYGESIIVERHFNRSGTSGFKLKDQNGKIVSTKKAELEDIIDAFALQIDNPMNVLTQDNARQFLNESNAKDKYKFFLKGTQLEGLKGEYDLLRINTGSQRAKADKILEDIEFLRKEAEKAVAKAKQASNVDVMRKRERLYADQIAWARVEEEEQDLHNIEREIELVTQIIQKRTVEVENSSEWYEQANEAYSEANQRKEDLQAQVGPIEGEQEELKGKFDQIKNALLKLQATSRTIIETISNKDKSIASYESQIEEHKQRQSEADNGRHAQKMQELEEAKQECERAKEAFTESTASLPVLKQHLKSAQDKKQPAETKLYEQRQALQRSQTTIRDLEQGQGRWIDSYPNAANLDRLLQAIKQQEGQGRFVSPPIGPIGRHIKLLKPEWGSILEKQSGAHLNAFIVTTKDDQNLLSHLMKNARCQYPIFISRDRITTALNEPDQQFDTWLRVLKFDNDLVRDQMIINASIEQIVLIRDRSEAEQFMHRGGNLKKNVKLCFTMSDRDTKKGHAINVGAQSGAMTINPIIAFTGSSRMQADKDSKLKEERESLARIQQEIRSIEAEVRELHKQEMYCNKKVQDHAKQRHNLILAFQQAQETVERLEAELSAATPDAGLIEQLQEALAEVQADKTFQEQQLVDATDEKTTLNKDARAQKNALQEATERLSNINKELDKVQARVDKLSNKRAEALRNKNRAMDELNAAKANEGEWEQKREQQAVIVADNISAAETISTRIEVPHGEGWESLTRKLETLQEQIARNERELGGSEEELMRKATIAKQKHKAKSDELRKTVTLIKAFQKSLDIRDSRLRQFKKDISRRARITFTYLLSERQFRGVLVIDHHHKQLEIHVQPDITVVNGSGRQTKTLSGGEKSFSTICLLLALWDAMGSPIRCLDEFDVFMDSVNRDISMKMMVSAARRAVGRQYILITPQAMNSVKHMDDVKVIKMNDPERGQTALNIGR